MSGLKSKPDQVTCSLGALDICMEVHGNDFKKRYDSSGE